MDSTSLPALENISLPEDWEAMVDEDYGMAQFYEEKYWRWMAADFDVMADVQDNFTIRAKTRVDILKVWSIKTPPRARGPKRVRS